MGVVRVMKLLKIAESAQMAECAFGSSIKC